MKYLVLAREDLTNQVEGRALRTKEMSLICRFFLEDVICIYGCIGKIMADRGGLDANKVREFFSEMEIKLSFTTTYNPDANEKLEHGHGPIVKALVKVCHGRIGEWPHVLPFALWADKTTHSSVTGYMQAELIFGQKPIMLVERSIVLWLALPWQDEISREDLLALRIWQLEQRSEDIEVPIIRLKNARLKNKEDFNKRYRLRPRRIVKGDWVFVYNSSLDNQHSTVKKFSQ
jgi:hypothetical protein